jgi:hypothetical protein
MRKVGAELGEDAGDDFDEMVGEMESGGAEAPDTPPDGEDDV